MKLGVVLLVAGAAIASGRIDTREDDKKVVMCYFGSWSVYRHGEGKFDVDDIDPFVCTHLMYGFAGISSDFKIKSLDPWNDYFDNWGKGAFDRFTNLKLINPGLKTLLAIGGWNEGSIHYSDMVLKKERRTKFIESCVEMLLKHNFDGLDMDWEYPGGRSDSAGRPEDKVNYILLLREMREKFDEHGLMITAAVSAGYTMIDQAYNVPAMAELLDYINLMSYDYHGWWDEHHFTGHNSPLYGSPEEAEEGAPGYRFNIDFSVKYWLEKGAKRSQLLMGLATYGRGFTLEKAANNGIYAPARAGCPAGPYTRTQGYLGYNEICDKVLTPGNWDIVRNEYIMAPYAVKDSVWLGYDDEESIRLKSKYILSEDLAGAMFWSIDTDDFHGKCGPKFTLILASAEELNGGPMTPPPDWTTPDPDFSPTTPGPVTPPPNDACDGTPGPKPNPDNCHEYYTCNIADGGWVIRMHSCGSLAFNPETGGCDWAYNVPLCSEGTTGGVTGTGAPTDCILGDPLISVPGDCNGYFECEFTNGSNGYVEQHCGAGLAFNPIIQACDWPSNVPGCT